MSVETRGIIGIFKDPDQMKSAAALIVGKKIKQFDAYSPFPVHGIEDAMGLKRSPLPWVTFAAGLTGCLSGLALQIWTSAVDWPINVGGKPMSSIPAFIPVTFEVTVLFAGLATAGAMFLFCKLPNFKAPVLDPEITNNHFVIFVSKNDSQYREEELKDLMRKAGAHETRVL